MTISIRLWPNDHHYGQMTVVAEKIVYNIGPWAQSYQRQIPENFRFLELKILFVVEATAIGEKN